ncbi:MAG: type II toxin-antitoxin system Phd/YefM family antitoxin [Solirubrobacterales bacterium]
MSRRKRIGIRELRQNLSVHLRGVKRGETLEVTERGHPVALLTPLPERASVRDRMIAAGRIRPRRGSLDELGRPPEVKLRKSISEALDEEREERLP